VDDLLRTYAGARCEKAGSQVVGDVVSQREERTQRIKETPACRGLAESCPAFFREAVQM
jgi:hypothetical protein